MVDDPQQASPVTFIHYPRRPVFNERVRDLLDRLAHEGHLEAAELGPEDRATAELLHARGAIRREGGRYVSVVLG
jgi:hypothetical protein